VNTQASATSESYLEPQVTVPASISAAQRLSWAMRRELWENRSIYIAPLAAFGFLLTLIHLPDKVAPRPRSAWCNSRSGSSSRTTRRRRC
jgi:hypothetical protein